MKDLFFTLGLPKIECSPNIQRVILELRNYDRHKQKIVDLVIPPQLHDMADSLVGLSNFAFPYLPPKYQSFATSFDNEIRFKPLTIDTNIFEDNLLFKCSSLYKALFPKKKENVLKCRQYGKVQPYIDLSTLSEKLYINLLNNSAINKLNNFKKCIIAK